MHPKIQARLTAEAEQIIPLAEQSWREALRATVNMNGAGLAGILAILQVFREHVGALAIAAFPFVVALFVATLSWIFTFTGSTDGLDHRFRLGEIVAKAALICAGLFLVGVLFTFCTVVGIALDR